MCLTGRCIWPQVRPRAGIDEGGEHAAVCPEGRSIDDLVIDELAERGAGRLQTSQRLRRAVDWARPAGIWRMIACGGCNGICPKVQRMGARDRSKG